MFKIPLKYINNDSETESIQIILNENSVIAGGIVLTGKTYRCSLNRELIVKEGSKIIGDAYCYGKTELKGAVYGTLYTDRFYLKTSSAVYENYIVNGEINRFKLPHSFVRLPLFSSDEYEYKLIKEL